MYEKALMVYTDEEFVAILKSFGRTPKSADEDVEAIQNWLKTQPQIPEITDREVILRFLCLNKFSVERAKEKIDHYYSIRHFTEELFSHHPLSSEMLEAYKVWHWITLPKLAGLCRVLVFKLRDDDPGKYNAEYILSHMLNFSEIRIRYDFCYSDVVVFDFSNVKVAHLLKVPLSLLKKAQIVVEKVYSMKLKQVHIINGFEALISLVKSVLKPKLRERIYLHRGYDSLYEHVPREVLPKDFGGEEKSLSELSEIQLKCFEETKEMFDVLIKMKSNEKLRLGKPVNDEFFGFYGNFKNIEVD